MASRVVKTERAESGALLVTVQHLDTDSFSRSVDRAAGRAWRASPHPERIRWATGAYAHTSEGRQCWSTVVYAASFADGYRALHDRGLPVPAAAEWTP